MAISPAILEEFIEDTRSLAAAVIQYGDRWGRYGKALEHRMSQSQREDLANALEELRGFLDSGAEE